jgi:hypothetical protein
MVVALPSSMTLTKLKIYAKPGNKHAMMPPDCKLGSNHARRESEEHSTDNCALQFLLNQVLPHHQLHSIQVTFFIYCGLP